MIVNNPLIAIKSALSELEKAGCLELLLAGKAVEINEKSYFGYSRGKSVPKRIGNLVNQILTNYNGGLSRVNAVEINFNKGTVKVKEAHLDDLREIAINYDEKYAVLQEEA